MPRVERTILLSAIPNVGLLVFQLVSPGGLISPSLSSLHSFMTRVHAAVVDHADSWPFKEPVDQLEVPDYYDVIKDPVDLSLIARRICSYEYYIKLEIFVADFKTMFTNARTYNSPDTIYYKCANRLESFFDHPWVLEGCKKPWF